MNREEHIEPLKDLVGWKGFTPPHMVQIPLEEYRRYIEDTIKGPTVEITLKEYNGLKDDNMRIQGKIWDLENQIRELKNELEKRDMAEMYERGMKREAERIITEIKRIVTDSDTEKEGKTKESEVMRNGRVRP